MADNDGNPRRNRDHLEDNPFIAFRRFADSQVSSLLNTVFTIPATIANYHNVHQAREACLFSKADKMQCEKLQGIEADIADLRHSGRELYRAGNVQELLKKSEELMKLDRIADDLRRDIVDQANKDSTDQDDRELVHRVANKRGQEWGWDWSWGFPKPFDEEHASSPSDKAYESEHERRDRRAQQLLEQMRSEALGPAPWREASDAARGAMEANPMLRAIVGENAWKEFQAFWEDVSNGGSRREVQPQTTRYEDASRYSPSVLDQDKNMQKTGVKWRQAYEDLMRTENQESADSSWPWRARRVALGYPKRVPWEGEEANDEPSYEYSHDHEDQHEEHQDGPVATSSSLTGRWRSHIAPQRDESSSDAKTELDTYEHLLSAYNHAHPVREANSILSTLTTIERTIGPDGSVTTKTVLKKRFADGREESSESIQTQHGQGSINTHNPRPRNAPPSAPERDQQDSPNPPKRSGWFWSS